MKKLLTFLIILFLPVAAFSQKKNQTNLPVFGKADINELIMKECDFDKNANSIKLLDYQEKELLVDYRFKIKTIRWVRIKILNKKGYDNANIIIPFISQVKGSKITDISAYIYNLDSSGRIITQKIDKKQIFRDNTDETVKKITFTFPNLKPGSVIEYRYEKTEKNSVHLEPWFFQDLIPTLISQCRIIIQGAITINKRFVAIDSIEQTRGPFKLGVNDQTYTLKNIPGFKPEPMMNSVADNLKRVEFAVQPPLGFANFFLSTKDKWKLFAYVLQDAEFFGRQFHTVIKGTESIVDSVNKLVRTEDKINYIFQRVKEQIKWDEQQTFYAGDIEEAWREGSGNSAEINILILNLLRKVNIKCSPILISTRNNGKPDQNFLSLGQFNGVDVLVTDSLNNYILDGTQKYVSYKIPPLNILNRFVFNADTSQINWIYITDTRPLLKTLVSIKARLSETGELTGETEMMFYDLSKAEHLMNMNKTEEEEREEEKEFLQKEFTELKVDNMTEKNVDNELLPLIQNFNFEYQLTSSGDFFFLDPFFLSRFRKNPFVDSVRHTHLDFGSNQFFKTTLHIDIPENLSIEHLPKNILLRMSDSTIIFTRTFFSDTNSILFINTMQVLNPIFDKEEYPGIKEFFDKIYEMAGQQVILMRKK